MKMTSQEVLHDPYSHPHWTKIGVQVIYPPTPKAVEEKPKEEEPKSFWEGIKGWFK